MRIKRGNVCRNRHKKILKLAKGFKGARSRIFKVANIAVMKALKYAYRDRRATKRNMRRLWIVRINAAVREQGMSYSRFVNDNGFIEGIGGRGIDQKTGIELCAARVHHEGDGNIQGQCHR